jgi:tRNA(fMet)-specific endonuclease VapC
MVSRDVCSGHGYAVAFACRRPSFTKGSGEFRPFGDATSVVTRIEILQGRFNFVLKAADGNQLLRAIAWLARSEELLRQITILPIDIVVAAQFDRLRRNKRLKKIGRADLLIAAISLATGATLVTRNLRHFRQVPGLIVEDWCV